MDHGCRGWLQVVLGETEINQRNIKEIQVIRRCGGHKLEKKGSRSLSLECHITCELRPTLLIVYLQFLLLYDIKDFISTFFILI